MKLRQSQKALVLAIVSLCLILPRTANALLGLRECELRYDIRNYMNWYDIGRNVIFALQIEQEDSVDDCEQCDRFGNLVGEWHYALADLEDNRQYWLDKDEIAE